MLPIPEFLTTLGAILLLGLLTDLLGRRTQLPRVTLLLLFGLLIGQQGLDLIPDFFNQRFELFANMALLMIGFLLGGKLTRKRLQQSGRALWSLSILGALITTLIVFGGLLLIGTPLELAILLGCIAAATAPAATVDTVLESGQETPFSELLLNVVALDDAWGLILFSLGLAVITGLAGQNGLPTIFGLALREVGGALLLGLAIGIPAAYLTGRIRPGQPMLTEALGLVFLCGGLALWLEVSFLISAMVLGATIANLARHHQYPFHAIEGIEWPFMVIFFLLAGASFELTSLLQLGLLGVFYILLRTVGKIAGGWVGSVVGQCNHNTKRWMGLALLPQAGAAIGMALVAAGQMPEYRDSLLTVVIGATVLFELIGPVMTRLALVNTRPH